MKTPAAKQRANNERKWYLIDAKDKVLGRIASKIAVLLRGKNNVFFSYHVDNGDYVVVINSEKVKVTGKKETEKYYYKHTRYLGWLKTETVSSLRRKKPTEILRKAVYGMLPKNKLRKQMMKRLRIVVGEIHPYHSQKPEIVSL